MHLSRSTWSAVIVVGVVLLVALASCWVTRQPATPPPGPLVTRTVTPTSVITVRPVTLTPTNSSPPTNTPTSTPRAPASPATMTRTYTPNPSTLITPSPQVLPVSGESPQANLVVTLLAGGAVLLVIGLLARWAMAKPKG